MQDSKLESLEKLIGYKFNDINILKQALTHPSLNTNSKLHIFQRLEFYGDAILNFIISDIIFNKHKDYDEGRLTRMKSALVCKETLYEIARSFNLQDFLIMSKGEEKAGGRDNVNNLENALEALIATIYLDGGIEACRTFILHFWLDELKSYTDHRTHDPKGAVQEWAQKRGSIPEYEVVSTIGSPHNPSFEIKLTLEGMHTFGTARSKKEAEKIAAKKMLQQL